MHVSLPATPAAAIMLAASGLLGLAACGDDDGEASKQTYVDAGNALCDETSAAIQVAFPDFDGEPTIEQVMELGARLSPVMQDWRDGVAALDPPDDLTDEHQRLLDELDSSITTLDSMAATEAGAQAALEAGGPPLDAPSAAAHVVFPGCPSGDE